MIAAKAGHGGAGSQTEQRAALNPDIEPPDELDAAGRKDVKTRVDDSSRRRLPSDRG